MKFIKSPIFALLIPIFTIYLQLIPSTQASFSDINENHNNYEAINYLEEHNIINGYDDGTFKGDKAINRVEFLKILMESREISLNISSSAPFSDTNKSAWYSPYINKAYAENIINGYNDGTFKANKEINKAEALKIIGKIYNWQSPNNTENPFSDVDYSSWYGPYIAFGKENNLIEYSTNYYYPSKSISRAEIAEIIYRSIKYKESSDSYSFSEIEEKLISENTFDNIKLSTSIPNTYYKNEVFLISGEIKNNSDKITIILKNPNTLKTERFEGTKQQFTENGIAIYFKQSGIYQLGILAGESGTTKAVEIQVLNEIPETENQNSISTLENNFFLKHENDQSYIEFKNKNNTLKTINFTQGSKQITYKNRQNIDILPIRYSDFKDFSESSITFTFITQNILDNSSLQISSLKTKSDNKILTAKTHHYSEISNEIDIDLPSILSSSQQDLEITAVSNVDIQKTAFMITPSGEVEEISLISNKTKSSKYGTLIPANTEFTIKYDFKENDTYILEINDPYGLALINHPIYIGRILPIIPDFFDLVEQEFFTDTFNLEQLKTELLNYINNDRAKHNLAALTLSNQLNNLAQFHTDNMVKYEFYSHFDQENRSPNDRRLLFDIKTSVLENIAEAVSIRLAHEGLMRSAAHRKNILDPDISQIGIGISLNNGYLLITEEFSDFEEDENSIQEKIEALKTNDFNYKSSLETCAKKLNTKKINNEDIDSSTLSLCLKENNISGSNQLYGISHSSFTELEKSFTEKSENYKSDFDNLGLDLQVDKNGNLSLIAIFNKS